MWRTVPVLVVASSGCLWHGDFEAGPSVPLPSSRGGEGNDAAAAMEVHAGVSPANPNASAGQEWFLTIGFAARSKVGPGLGQVAFGPEFCGIYDAEAVMPMLCGGLHMLQVEGIDGDVVIGSGMFARPAVAFPLGDARMPASIFVAAPFEWNLRFGDEVNRLHAGLVVGFGVAFRSEAWRR